MAFSILSSSHRTSRVFSLSVITRTGFSCLEQFRLRARRGSVSTDEPGEHLLEGPGFLVLVERLVLVPNTVIVLVVDMNEGALDVRQAFELTLQCLADVVRKTELDVRVHDDVDFDVQPFSSMVGTAL